MSTRPRGPSDLAARGAKIAFMAMAMASCGKYTSEETRIPVPRVVAEGTIATQGVSIWAMDSSFRMDAGEPFRSPFVTQKCVKVATSDNYDIARRAGAERVVVQVPGLSQPLYGLLALCRVPNFATGPASRSYQIEVPESYVAATSGGRVSTVYETTNWEDFPAWQLWLSRSPRVWQ